MAVQRGEHRVVVECDSKVLYFALVRGTTDMSYFISIVEDIVQLARSLEAISFRWVRWTDNMVAHRLASLSITCVQHFVLSIFLIVVLAYFMPIWHSR